MFMFSGENFSLHEKHLNLYGDHFYLPLPFTMMYTALYGLLCEELFLNLKNV
jgi:hypothetical protein